MQSQRPMPIRGILAGLAGGLAASFAMNRFQKTWSLAFKGPDRRGKPATVKAANRLSKAATGDRVKTEHEAAAGQSVHYLFGAGVGAAYGLLAEYRPQVTRGFGTGFGVAAATLFDELGVPAAGLGKWPSQAAPATHAYSYASHLLFGAATEAVRRLLRSS